MVHLRYSANAITGKRNGRNTVQRTAGYGAPAGRTYQMVQGSGCAPVPLVPQQPIGTCLWTSVQSAGFLPLYGEGIIVCRSGYLYQSEWYHGSSKPSSLSVFRWGRVFFIPAGKTVSGSPIIKKYIADCKTKRRFS